MKEFIFEHSYERRDRSYFWLATVFLAVSTCGLYYAIKGFIRSYDPQHSPDYTFSERLFDDFENRLMLMIVFLVAVILFFRSLYIKNKRVQTYVKNFISVRWVDDQEEVSILSKIKTTTTRFKKTELIETEKRRVLFNLNEVEDFVHVKSRKNEKAKRLNVDTSMFNRSEDKAGGGVKFSIDENFDSPALGKLNLISLESYAPGSNTASTRSRTVNGPTNFNEKYKPRQVKGYHDFIAVFEKGDKKPRYIGYNVEPIIDILTERFPSVELE